MNAQQHPRIKEAIVSILVVCETCRGYTLVEIPGDEMLQVVGKRVTMLTRRPLKR